MSTFRVVMNQGTGRSAGGYLDTAETSDGYSVQRTMYAMGPHKINRKLSDGETFTDCNYWKRFAYPTLPFNEAFIEVVTDDGAPYVDGEESLFIRTYTYTLPGGSGFSTAGNTFDIVGDNGGPAAWAIITSTANTAVRINSLTTSDFVVEANTSQTFNRGDLLINTIQVAKSSSGSATVEIQVGVLSVCNS